MRKWKISRLYAQIITSFLCIVLLAGAVLLFASVWFSHKNETDFMEKAVSIMDTSSQRVQENLEIVYNVSSRVMSNQVVMDNLRPESVLTTENRYYYKAIVDLLDQANFQMGGMIDSIFLYVDDQRVLYSTYNSGSSSFDMFFSNVIEYENYGADFWRSLLNSKGSNYFTLEPDVHRTYYANIEPAVIPLVYHAPGVGGTNVLVTNLSCEAILKQYRMDSLSDDVLMALYSPDGSQILGSKGIPGMEVLRRSRTVRVDGREYFVLGQEHPALNVSIFALVPVSALADVTSYYRIGMILLVAVFIAFGVTVTVVMSRRAYAPIQQVHDSISSIPDVNAVHSLNSEIEVIRSAISQLADERELYRARNHQHSYHYITQGFATLLDGRTLNDDVYYTSLLSKEYRFRMRGFRCADVLVDADGEESYLSRVELLEDVRERLSAAFQDAIPVLSVSYQSNMLVLLIDSDGDDEADIRSRLQCVDEGLAGLCSLRIGLGQRVEQLSLLPRSFEQANSEVFAIPAPLSPSSEPDDFTFDRGEVINAVNTRDIKHIEDVITDILTRAKQAAVPYAEAVGIVQDIYKTVADAQRQRGAQILIRDRGDEVNIMEVLILSPDVNITPLMAALLPYVPYQKDLAEKSTDKIAHQLQEFIDDHYSEELSLDILADKMNMSSKYLSRVFKQVMGVNLSDYLAFVRVGKIKELLMTEMSLNQIMESVGVFSRTTFTRMFRRQEGMTPTEYRSLHRDSAKEK